MNDSSDKKSRDDGRTRTEQKTKKAVDKTLERLNEGPITYGTIFKYTLLVLAAIFIVWFLLMTFKGNEDSATEPESAETAVERAISDLSDLRNDESGAKE